MKATESKPRAARKPKESTARWKNALPSREDLQKLKKAALIREASRAFKEKGYHNVSLDDVAERLNVTKAALYYYVKGKRELLYETQCVTHDLGDMALAEANKGKNGLDKVARIVSRFIQLVTDDTVMSPFMSPLDDMLPEHQEIIRKRRRAFDKRMREVVQEGIDDGSIAPCEPKLAIAWLMGAINWIPQWFDSEGEYSPEALAETLVQFMSHGIAAQAQSPAPPTRSTAATSPRRSEAAS
ncbi:TetR/AcrR family transcriptional regulator [Paraburkholderia oxyphila]|uniref:TetR/AcrR family transcriptional regulator n=1 Tax=Paraburkholderia oxyphila TaxID=614212 RepID=UPI000487FBE2|nr:TetR/AcrR family transcriptional regulator [Paraburkholderia oxyphila]